MTMQALSADDPAALAAAAAVLKAGQPVVLPTDTVYGLAALPTVTGATAALFALKDRAETTPLAVLVGSTDQAVAIAAPLTPLARRVVERFWPGPLTLVVERRSDLDWKLGGSGSTIGIRCPAHPFVLGLAGRLGPIATTSANRHGEPTPVGAREAAETLTGEVGLVIDGGECAGVASTVLDLSGPEPRLLRAGPVGDDVLALITTFTNSRQ